MNTPAVDLEAPGARRALAQAADFRLIALLFRRPTAAVRTEAAALAAESRDAALRDVHARLRELDEPAHAHLFGPGGPVSPRQAAYIGRADPAQALHQLRAAYDAFGYRFAPDEPPDHVAVEADFAAYLCFKEAYALARGDAEAADVAAAARARLLGEHLSVVASGIAARTSGTPIEGLADLARALSARAGKPPADPLEEATEEDDEMQCGGCPG